MGQFVKVLLSLGIAVPVGSMGDWILKDVGFGEWATASIPDTSTVGGVQENILLEHFANTGAAIAVGFLLAYAGVSFADRKIGEHLEKIGYI